MRAKLIALVALGGALGVAPAAYADVIDVNPTGDAYVVAGDNSNHGSEFNLKTSGAPTARTSYLHFYAPNVVGTITNVQLKLHVVVQNGQVGVSTVSDTSWDETTITDANKPALGTASSRPWTWWPTARRRY